MTYRRRPIATFNKPTPSQDGPRVNSQIRAPQVRVVDAEGEMLGVMTVRDALQAAERLGLDLIEISPNAEPPVCKISDFGKYRYEMQKKAHAAKKNQKIIETKELKLRPNIEEHDIQVKIKNAKRFLSEGDKVRISMQFRGRENEHKENGLAILRRVREEVTLVEGKIEQDIKFEGNNAVMVVVAAK